MNSVQGLVVSRKQFGIELEREAGEPEKRDRPEAGWTTLSCRVFLDTTRIRSCVLGRLRAIGLETALA